MARGLNHLNQSLFLFFFSLLFLVSESPAFVATHMRKAKREAPMVMVWKTDNPGVSSSTQIKLPLDASGTYNFQVDWGDGQSNRITSFADPFTTHTYASAGTYTIRLTGSYTVLRFANGDQPEVFVPLCKFKYISCQLLGCLA